TQLVKSSPNVRGDQCAKGPSSSPAGECGPSRSRFMGPSQRASPLQPPAAMDFCPPMLGGCTPRGAGRFPGHPLTSLIQGDAILLSERMVRDAGDWPRPLQAWLATADLESIVPHFISNIDGCKPAHTCQLITKILIKGCEPLGQHDPCFTVLVEYD